MNSLTANAHPRLGMDSDRPDEIKCFVIPILVDEPDVTIRPRLDIREGRNYYHPTILF